MAARSWLKAVFHRGGLTPAPVVGDLATEQWADVPMIPATRSRPPVPAAADDENWDAVIARARQQQVVSLKTPSRPPPLPRQRPSISTYPSDRIRRSIPSPDTQVTPPPVVDRRPPPTWKSDRSGLWSGASEQLKARLDALITGPGVKRTAALRAALAARRPGELDAATPPPVVGSARQVGRTFKKGIDR